jgi:SAM-dependent methyltransferase
VERSVYAIEAAIEETHWWFCGRRRLFARELRQGRIAPPARVLDVGTSSGTNLRLLRALGFTDVIGLDQSADAIAFCAAKGLGTVERGDVCAMPFADESFDLVLATDIIEHVEDDRRALREIVRVLRPGGTVLVTVPAFRLLWGLQDRVAQHKRRYRLAALGALLERAGLTVRRAYYFNYFLFLPILVARRLIDAFGIRLQSENDFNTRLLNRLLTAVFAIDVRSAPVIKPPFGVSLLALAMKAPSPGAASIRT